MDWEKSELEDLKLGWSYDTTNGLFHCVFCNTVTEKGRIYSQDGNLYDAERQMKEHVKTVHGSSFQALVQMDKRMNGISESQKNILLALYEGKTDKEIASEHEGIGSPSTVRQHRFKLKEKQRQAKLFLAIMELFNEKNEEEPFSPIHKGATMLDERWAVTEAEEEKVMQTYVDASTGKVKQFPSKEKRKIVILRYILKAFDKGQQYTEKQVNDHIKNYYDDFVTIRRYFIEYGFLDRNRDGSAYWLKD